VAALKAGSKWANRPDCSVDVVDAMTSDWADATPQARPNATKTIVAYVACTRASGLFLLRLLMK
jgi:hypothetical protein